MVGVADEDIRRAVVGGGGGGNSIGKALRVTTFGESHGKAVGAVVDGGVPAGLPLSEDDVRFELQFRRPGGGGSCHPGGNPMSRRY